MTIAKVKRDLSAFRSNHDRSVIVPRKIKEALDSLKKEHGDEGWEYEGEFLKRAGISQTDVGQHREAFEGHVVQTKGANAKRVWFASTKTASAARESLT